VSDNYDGTMQMRAHSEFNQQPNDFDYSTRNLARTNLIAVSMQERNRKMRSDAKLNNQNALLEEKVME